jgi:hypothetical protein
MNQVFGFQQREGLAPTLLARFNIRLEAERFIPQPLVDNFFKTDKSSSQMNRIFVVSS